MARTAAKPDELPISLAVDVPKQSGACTEPAAELGRLPGELKHIAKLNCANEPARRAGQCKPCLQKTGSAEGSRAGWYRKHRILTHFRRTP